VTGHVCDELCVCPEHRTPLIYWPLQDDHSCAEAACEYGGGMYRALAAQRGRRADRLAKAYDKLTDEVVAGLSTSEHHMTIIGGLPFCKCWHSLGSGDASGDFITHALGLLREPQAPEQADANRQAALRGAFREAGLIP